jgi:hypothetical protein
VVGVLEGVTTGVAEGDLAGVTGDDLVAIVGFGDRKVTFPSGDEQISQ